MKSSINSDDEENIKVKNKNNKNNFKEYNELNTNLITEDESIFFNFKNK